MCTQSAQRHIATTCLSAHDHQPVYAIFASPLWHKCLQTANLCNAVHFSFSCRRTFTIAYLANGNMISQIKHTKQRCVSVCFFSSSVCVCVCVWYVCGVYMYVCVPLCMCMCVYSCVCVCMCLCVCVVCVHNSVWYSTDAVAIKMYGAVEVKHFELQRRDGHLNSNTVTPGESMYWYGFISHICSRTWVR
jgi:hypothetical protein